MPTYEYACTRCGQHVEVFQRFSEESLTTCGACGGELRKVFHPAGIHFKGSGFYSTDNRSKVKTATEPKPSESKPSEPKPSESKPAESKKSEKKPESAAPSSSGAKESA